MSLLEKISDKLDAILKEEDEKIEDNGETEIVSIKRKPKEKQKKTKEENNLEDLEYQDEVSFMNVGKDIKVCQPVNPLFPSDIAPAQETVVKPKFLQSNNIFINEKNRNKLDVSSLKCESLPPLFKELQSSNSFVEAKMVELSKKIRELNSQLISTQNKLKIAESRNASQNASESLQRKPIAPKEVSEDKLTQLEIELKELSDKYQACNAKLCDTRNQVQQHKHEIKLLHKALASEVGDNYSIHTVTSDGWRGRAQQICSLQQKVTELSEKLSLTSIPSIEKSVSAMQSFEKSQDKERISTLTKEVEELKIHLNDAKNKGDQARARVNVLSSDMAVIKTKYETLVVKNEEDNKLINTLTTKIANISQKNHDKELHLVKKHNDQLAALTTELKQEKVKTDQYQKIINERDARIKKLEEKIQEYQNYTQSCLAKGDSLDGPQISGFFTERPTTQQSIISNSIYSQSIEVERLRLMELITVLNKRLDEERKTLDRIQDQLRVEKQKSVKLESKVNKLELERVGKNYRRPTGRPESLNKFELENLKDNCALLKEKCLALESRVERLRLEKEEDARIYVRMVEEARSALKDQIRKSNSCSASS